MSKIKKPILIEKDLLKALDRLGIPFDDNEEQRNSVVCSLIGHSKIQTTCFGYYYCGRCGDQLGDSLGSFYMDAPNVVIVGHDCDVCRENFKTCTWKDTLFAPDPFARLIIEEEKPEV